MSEYDPVFAKKPFEAYHEHKFVRTSRYVEECVAGDGCRLGRMSREWIADMQRKPEKREP
jgi:hypothetical protein